MRLFLFDQMKNEYILIKICETHPGGILRVFLRFGLFSPWYSYRSYSYKKKRVGKLGHLSQFTCENDPFWTWLVILKVTICEGYEFINQFFLSCYSIKNIEWIYFICIHNLGMQSIAFYYYNTISSGHINHFTLNLHSFTVAYGRTWKESDFRTKNLGTFPWSFCYFSQVYRLRYF